VWRSVTVLRSLLVGLCSFVVGAGFGVLAIADRRGAGMLGFALACLAVAVAVPVLAMVSWRRREARRDDGAWILVSTLRRTRTVSAALAASFLGFGWLLFGVRYLGWDSQADELGLVGDVVLTGLMLILGVLGGYLCVVAARMVPIGRTPLLRVLRTAPHQVTQVYQSVSDSKGRATVLPGIRKARSVGEQAFITVCLSDGRRITLSVECDSVPAVVAELTRIAPYAQVGYDPDAERSHTADPAG
jgi:hypothetical protein